MHLTGHNRPTTFPDLTPQLTATWKKQCGWIIAGRSGQDARASLYNSWKAVLTIVAAPSLCLFT